MNVWKAKYATLIMEFVKIWMDLTNAHVTKALRWRCTKFNKSSKIKSFIITPRNTPKLVTTWRGPTPRHCARATQLLSKKYRSGGESLAALCPIWPARDLNLRLPAPKNITVQSWKSRYRSTKKEIKLWLIFRKVYVYFCIIGYNLVNNPTNHSKKDKNIIIIGDKQPPAERDCSIGVNLAILQGLSLQVLSWYTSS